jgi:hypothetical protein
VTFNFSCGEFLGVASIFFRLGDIFRFAMFWAGWCVRSINLRLCGRWIRRVAAEIDYAEPTALSGCARFLCL